MLNLERMLEKCRDGQWSPNDLDWTLTPRPLSPDDEMAVCQYFTDMSQIELLAAALFEVQRQHTDDPVLQAIFTSFIRDEQRHSEVALRLADFYDVHRLRSYRINPHLMRFRQSFLEVLDHVSPEVAAAYVTVGELLLDVALLRSLNDFVDDAMSDAAMQLINRDESRHIAVDYHMAEHYAGPEYAAWEAAQPRKTLRQRAAAARAMATFLYRAPPFLRQVFFEPMDLTDPAGRRLVEAFKRAQLLGRKPEVRARPFPRFIATIQSLHNRPVFGRLMGPLLRRIIGLDARMLDNLLSDDEGARAVTMSFQELAREALDAKRRH